MSVNRNHRRKKILADPAGMYSRTHPDATTQQISTLSTLAQQYAEQKQQHKDARNQTRKFSRQIGEARQSGEPTEGLMASMQAHSTRLRDLSDRLSDTEGRILHFFEACKEPGKEITQATSAAPAGRIYPAASVTRQDVTISLADPEQEEWNAYVTKNPAASFYHRSEWKELIHKSFGHEGYYFSAHNRQGQLVGILPIIRLDSRLFGDFMVSMPYFNYGGAIADHPLIEQQLMEAASQHAQELGSSHVEFRDDIPRDDFPAHNDKVNMILALPGNHEEIWEEFSPKLRAQVRRPRRENPTVSHGGLEYLDDFYAVFVRNMRDLGTPVYGKSFFRNILKCFPDNCSIMVIRLEGRPVASGFLIGHRDTLEIPWASTLRDVNHLSMNMLLYWEVLKFAIERQYSFFDFGRSSKNSGTFRFKQQWGARPKPLFWHYWLKGDSKLPALNPRNPKYALAINIWKRLPLMVTEWLGPQIVKNLP